MLLIARAISELSRRRGEKYAKHDGSLWLSHRTSGVIGQGLYFRPYQLTQSAQISNLDPHVSILFFNFMRGKMGRLYLLDIANSHGPIGNQVRDDIENWLKF